MNAQLTGSGVVALAGVIVIGGVAYWVYKNHGAIVEAINPMSDKNIASRTADAITKSITGDQTQTFGGWLYDTFNPDVFDPKQYTRTPATTPEQAAKMVRDAVNGETPETTPNLNTVFTQPPPPVNLNTIFGLGFVSAVDPVTQRTVFVPKLTPTTWTLIAGVSLALYVHKTSKRRRRIRR